MDFTENIFAENSSCPGLCIRPARAGTKVSSRDWNIFLLSRERVYAEKAACTHPENHIYPKAAFPYPAFHFTGKEEKADSLNETGNKRDSLSPPPFFGTNRSSRNPERDSAAKPVQVFPAQPRRMRHVRNKNPTLTSVRPCFRLKSHSGSCGNTPQALSRGNGSRRKHIPLRDKSARCSRSS